MNDTHQRPQLREPSDAQLGQANFLSRKLRSSHSAQVTTYSPAILLEKALGVLRNQAFSPTAFISVGMHTKLAPVNSSFQLRAFGVQPGGTGFSIFST